MSDQHVVNVTQNFSKRNPAHITPLANSGVFGTKPLIGPKILPCLGWLNATVPVPPGWSAAAVAECLYHFYQNHTCDLFTGDVYQFRGGFQGVVSLLGTSVSWSESPNPLKRGDDLPDRGTPTVRISIPGKPFETVDFERWVTFLDVLMGTYSARPTRLDVNLTLFGSWFSIADIVKSVSNGCYVGRARAGGKNAKFVEYRGFSEQGVAGHTLRIGSITSDFHCKFYDKGLEQGIASEGEIIRLEGVFRGCEAEAFVAAFTTLRALDSDGSPVEFCSCSDVCWWALMGRVDFRDTGADRRNVQRAERCPFWARFLELGCDGGRFFRKRVVPGVRRAMLWLFDQCSAMLATCYEAFPDGWNDEFVERLLKHGEARLGKRHRAMLDEFERLMPNGLNPKDVLTGPKEYFFS